MKSAIALTPPLISNRAISFSLRRFCIIQFQNCMLISGLIIGGTPWDATPEQRSSK
jgi:hypothetical protein